MWLKAQNEMTGFWPHAAMGPVERMVRRHCAMVAKPVFSYVHVHLPAVLLTISAESSEKTV